MELAEMREDEEAKSQKTGFLVGLLKEKDEEIRNTQSEYE